MDFIIHIQILNHAGWSVQINGVALGLDVHSHTAAPEVRPPYPLESAGWWKS